MFNGLQGTRPPLFKVSDTLKNFKLAVDSQVDRLMSDYTSPQHCHLVVKENMKGGK